MGIDLGHNFMDPINTTLKSGVGVYLKQRDSLSWSWGGDKVTPTKNVVKK